MESLKALPGHEDRSTFQRREEDSPKMDFWQCLGGRNSNVLSATIIMAFITPLSTKGVSHTSFSLRGL